MTCGGSWPGGGTAAVLVPPLATPPARLSAAAALAFGLSLVALAALGALSLALARARRRAREAAESERRARELAEGRARRLGRLHAVTAALSKAATPAEVGDVIAREAFPALGGRVGELAVLSSDGACWESLRRVARVEDSQPTMGRSAAKATPSMREAVRRGEPVVALAAPPGETGRSRAIVVTVPLLSAGRAVGALEVMLETPQELAAEEVEFQRVIGRHCGEALERARLFVEAQRARARAEAATERLAESERRLREASAQKTRFLATVSPDLRAPANAVGLLAQLIAREADASGLPADSPLRLHARDAAAAARSLSSFLDGLLDGTALETGRRELAVSVFPLRDLVEECVRTFAPLAREKGLALDASLPEAGLGLVADRAEVLRALANLVANAVKFTPSGRVRVGASTGGDGLVLEVEDTGPGIPPEHRDAVLCDTPPAGSQARAAGEGAGLGLSIARRAIEAHGGRLSVESDTGRGATFRVLLPASRLVPLPPRRAADPEPEPGPASLLLVDDDEVAARALAELLVAEGYDVRCASACDEAVGALASSPADVVLVDLRMPGGDGIDLVRRLRAGPGAGPRVLVVSGDVTADRVASAQAAGADGFVAKPFRLPELLGLLARLRAQPAAPYSFSLL